MSQVINYINQELTQIGFKSIQKENGREGVDFTITTNNGNEHELYLQSLELGQQRSIKIPKQQLGEPKDNLWIALVLLLEGEELGLFLIPSKTFETPDNYIFIDNPQGERFAHLANWEIKVFSKGMPKLNGYRLENQLKNLIKFLNKKTPPKKRAKNNQTRTTRNEHSKHKAPYGDYKRI